MAIEHEFADSGLRLTFSRDMAQKYTRYWNVKLGEKVPQPPKPDPTTTWQVTGYYDFLQVNEFYRLDELKAWSKDDDALVSWRSFADLVLIPFRDGSPKEDFLELLRKPGQGEKPANPLLVIIEVTLSPAVFHFESSPGRVMRAMRDTIRLLEEAKTSLASAASGRAQDCAPDFSFPMHSFASLSGPDLVVLAVARDARQLWGIHRLVSRARRMQLSEVAQGKEISAPPTPGTPQWPGHAFVSVEPILAFSLGAKDCFSSEEFRRVEDLANLELRFSLRVDSGHESKAIEDMRRTLEGDRSGLDWLDDIDRPLISWGSYAVPGFFRHLAQLVRVWEECWFAASVDNHWREEHLIDSTTTLSFKDNCQEDCPEHPVHADRVWKVTQSVKDVLDDIRDNLKVFGREFLNPSQQAELDRVYLTLRSCFFRQGLLGTARDLLPFFWQLSRALSLGQEWGDYLNPSGETYSGDDLEELVHRRGRFSMQLQKLFAHAQRALRNRVEHRSLQADPPIPHTLAHGACKLINVYSAVFYLASELFLGPPAGRARPARDIYQFAAAVCAGSCGQIQCDELFADFREYIEASGGRQSGTIACPGRPLSARAQTKGWSTRLLLLDISGNALLRPELCFVHCLHEMAELSEWIMLDTNREIRSLLNKWLFEEIAWAFADALARSERQPSERSPSRGDLKARKDELYDLAAKFAVYSGVVYGLAHFDAITWAGVQQIGPEVTERPHPDALIRGLARAIEQAAEELDRDRFKTGGRSRVREFLDEELRASMIVHPGRVATSAVRSPEFAKSISMIRGLAPEIVGDVGMWCALDHILGRGTIRTEEKRVHDLHRVFKSLLRAAAEANTPKVALARVSKTVVRRWAIQAAAMTADQRWRDGIREHIGRLQQELEEEGLGQGFPLKDKAHEWLRECNERESPTQFDPSAESGSLVAGLSKLDSYRGTKVAPAEQEMRAMPPYFPPESKFSETDRELFEAFRDAWRAATEGEEAPMARSDASGAPSESEDDAKPRLESRSIEFVFKLWATAARFSANPMLEQA